VSIAEFDAERFRTPADEWVSTWAKADRDRPFELEVRQLPGQTHLSAAPESFRQGMQWLFEEASVEE
jgi:hypothetical protein